MKKLNSKAVVATALFAGLSLVACKGNSDTEGGDTTGTESYDSNQAPTGETGDANMDPGADGGTGVQTDTTTTGTGNGTGSGSGTGGTGTGGTGSGSGTGGSGSGTGGTGTGSGGTGTGGTGSGTGGGTTTGRP